MLCRRSLSRCAKGPQVLSSSSLSDGRHSVEVHASTVGADCSLQMSLLVYGTSLLPLESLQMCTTEAAALSLQYQVSALGGGCRYSST